MPMTILLVDDEMLICNWLSILIDQLGRDDVTTVSVGNAADALAYCDNNKVDLVITDITMPQKSGLELLQDLSLSHPNIKSAVLSAYDDYKYIREAFKLGALDYILKSEMKQEDIVSLLNKLKIFESLEKGANSSTHSDRTSVTRAYTQLKEFLAEDISEEAFLSNTPLTPAKSDIGICFFFLNANTSQDKDRLALLDILNRTLESESLSGSSYILDKNCFVCLFNLRTTIVEYQQNILNKLVLLGQRNIDEYSSFSVIDSLAIVSEQDVSIRKGLVEGSNTLHMRYYYGNRPNIEPVDMPEDTIKSLNTALLHSLNVGNYVEALNYLQSFVASAHESLWNPNQLKSAMVYAITILCSFLDQLPSATLYFKEYSHMVKQVTNTTSAEELISALDLFQSKYLQFVKNNSQHISPSIQRVVDYINDNYMKKLTLENISEYVYLNKTYLSQLFTKQMNISLVNYIEKVRIQRAKSLLATTNLSVSQISEDIGYSSQSYFTKVFKKATGVGPLKYRSLFFPTSASDDNQ